MILDVLIGPGALRRWGGVVTQQILNFKTQKLKRRRGVAAEAKSRTSMDVRESLDPSIYYDVNNKINNGLLHRTRISPNIVSLESQIPTFARCRCGSRYHRCGQHQQRRQRFANVDFLKVQSTNFRYQREQYLLHWCRLDCHLDPCGTTQTMTPATTTQNTKTALTVPLHLTQFYLTIMLLLSCVVKTQVSCQQYMPTALGNSFHRSEVSPTASQGQNPHQGYDLNLPYNLSHSDHGSHVASTSDSRSHALRVSDGCSRIGGDSDCGSDYYEKRLIVNKIKNSYSENSIVHNPNRGDHVDVNENYLAMGPSEPAVVDNKKWESTESPINDENLHLIKFVMDGLGLWRLPDMKKANISQQEYVTKYREYLRRIHERSKRELVASETQLQMLTIPHDITESRRRRQRRDLRSSTDDGLNTGRQSENARAKASVILKFPLNIDATQLQAGDIEEANIRLMLFVSPSLATRRPSGGDGGSKKRKHNKGSCRPSASPMHISMAQPQKHVINLKVYQLLEKGRRLWLDGRKLEIELDHSKPDETHSQWLDFDVTKAVEGWLRNRKTNLGLEVKCENCYRHGARIIDDLSAVQHRGEDDGDDNGANEGDTKDEEEHTSRNADDSRFDLTPSLNIIGRLGVSHQEHRSRKHSSEAAQQHLHHHTMAEGWTLKRHQLATDCYKKNQRCCRHTMEVVFKEIKGFEFIIQPKVFDAGYCRGRCPPSYKPAHHHAVLQSLIWKQNRTRAPRPCCAPSKLVELEVLHVDEKDSEKLKISTWTDMRVLECACS